MTGCGVGDGRWHTCPASARVRRSRWSRKNGGAGGFDVRERGFTDSNGAAGDHMHGDPHVDPRSNSCTVMMSTHRRVQQHQIGALCEGSPAPVYQPPPRPSRRLGGLRPAGTDDQLGTGSCALGTPPVGSRFRTRRSQAGGPREAPRPALHPPPTDATEPAEHPYALVRQQATAAGWRSEPAERRPPGCRASGVQRALHEARRAASSRSAAPPAGCPAGNGSPCAASPSLPVGSVVDGLSRLETRKHISPGDR